MTDTAPHPRVGFGSDLHRLIPGGDGFWLAGVRVACAYGIVAHSDGDTALHALTDALLGALAVGDIGDLFPDTSSENKDRRSRDFVAEALRHVRSAGYNIGNVDLTLRLQRPKLGDLKNDMKAELSTLLDISPDCVSVKAKTGEGVDAVGRGEAVACEAVVLLMPYGDLGAGLSDSEGSGNDAGYAELPGLRGKAGIP